MPQDSARPGPEAMSRRSVEAASSRDFDGALEVFAPDRVWDMSKLGMGIFAGHGAIRAFFEDWTAAYDDYEITLEEFCDLGDGVTFQVAFQRGRPADGAGFVELRYATVATWADGLIHRSTNYTDIDEARVAAKGLAKELASSSGSSG